MKIGNLVIHHKLFDINLDDWGDYYQVAGKI